MYLWLRLHHQTLILMNLKTVFSSLIVVLHLVILVWYFSHPNGWASQPDNIATACMWFYCVPLILVGINMFTVMVNDCPLNRLVIAFHSTFIISLGVLFSLYYSQIIHHTNSEKLYSICCIVIAIFAVILLIALRNGHFKR